MDDITFEVLKIVLSICAALITVYVVPYIKTLKEDKRYASLVDMVEVAVKAAEQTYKASGKGAAKREEVLAFVQNWIKEQGINVSYEQLDQLLEACVYQMKQDKQ